MRIFPQCRPYCAQRELGIVKEMERVAGKEFYRPRLNEVRRCLFESTFRPPKNRVTIAGTKW